MIDPLSRHTLEADLLHHQQSGDVAAQAKTLMALAEIAYDEDEYNIAIGLYGQAWAMAEKTGDKQRVAQVIQALAKALEMGWWDSDELPRDFDRSHAARLYEMALDLCIQNGDQPSQANLYYSMGISHLYSGNQERAFLQQALVLYRDLSEIRKQVRVLRVLIERYAPADPHRREFLEHLLVLYCHLEDENGMAHVYTDLGTLEYWTGHYEAARRVFQTALDLCVIAEDHSRVLDLTLRLYTLILDAEGQKAAYHYYEQTSLWLRRLFIDPALIGRWFLDIANRARKHQHFHAARMSFQQALASQAALNQPIQQAETYWTWGLMEYHDTEYKSMGFHLCQRAAGLSKHYHPDKNQYQKKLGVMHREMERAARKRSTP